MLVTFGFGAIGWVDDYRKVVYKDPRGMSSREKYFWQSLIGLFAAVYLAFSVSEASNVRVFDLFMAWVRSGLSMDLPARADLMLPFVKSISYPLGVWGFIALTYLVIVGSSNAVNLTDGLDGLVIMPIVLVGASLGVFAYVMGSAVYSKYLLFPHIPGAGELLIFCSAMGGAGLAFLWFNTHPAQVFMGDVGALALGGALGTIAVIVRQEIVLFIMGGIFVAETLSVMLQVTLVQVHQAPLRRRAARLQDGAAASPFRTVGLEGNAGRRALLDHHDDVVSVRFVDAEVALSRYQGEARRCSARSFGIGKSRWCSCWDWVNPASRWRAGARGTAVGCAWPIRARRRRTCPRCAAHGIDAEFVGGAVHAGAARRRRTRRHQPRPVAAGRRPVAADRGGARARHPGVGRNRTVRAGAEDARREAATRRR